MTEDRDNFTSARYGMIKTVILCAVFTGCQGFLTPVSELPITPPPPSPDNIMPREKSLTSLPTYRIEPPDILEITTVKTIPKSPHILDIFDVVALNAQGTADQLIAETYSVNPSGNIDLGPPYGQVRVTGLTIEEATVAIDRQLRREVGDPQVSLSLLTTTSTPQLADQVLVGPDGTIPLGAYGKVYVAGSTVAEAKERIEAQLAKNLEDPEVLVSVLIYNSKTYYVITEGSGFGDSVFRLPITGGETILNAISSIRGISDLSSGKIWIARPSPNGLAPQILPVDWDAITRRGDTSTNYQIMPHDRVFIAIDKRNQADSMIIRMVQPLERLFGFTSLGARTLTSIVRFGQRTF